MKQPMKTFVTTGLFLEAEDTDKLKEKKDKRQRQKIYHRLKRMTLKVNAGVPGWVSRRQKFYSWQADYFSINYIGTTFGTEEIGFG